MLTEKQMIDILENKKINECTDDEKKQVFNFAFGEEFMESKDKGQLKEYKQTIAEQFINSIPNDLQEKLADFLLTIDKRGLDEILAGNSNEQVITKLWDILNLFNPNGTDNDPTFTSDEWDEICIQMAWITEDFNK